MTTFPFTAPKRSRIITKCRTIICKSTFQKSCGYCEPNESLSERILRPIVWKWVILEFHKSQCIFSRDDEENTSISIIATTLLELFQGEIERSFLSNRLRSRTQRIVPKYQASLIRFHRLIGRSNTCPMCCFSTRNTSPRALSSLRWRRMWSRTAWWRPISSLESPMRSAPR